METGDKIVLVTGGGFGIGLAVVEKFLEHGAKVAIIVDINEKLGTKAAQVLTNKYGVGKSVFYKCDVVSDLEETFEKIVSRYKHIDLLVNNAGVANEKSIKKIININVIALMEWTIKFYEYMRKDRGGKGGTIINVSSVYGLKITPFLPYYHASKFAVVGFTKSLGHEYNFKKTGVRLVTMCPGFTYTRLHVNFQLRDESMLEAIQEEIKKEEWQEIDDVGKGIIEIFEKAESGTVWIVEGSRPAIMFDH